MAPSLVEGQCFPADAHSVPRMDLKQRIVDAVAGRKLGDKFYEARVEKFTNEMLALARSRLDAGFEDYDVCYKVADKFIKYDKSERRRGHQSRELRRKNKSASPPASIPFSIDNIVIPKPTKKDLKDMCQEERIQYERARWEAKEAAKELKWQKKEERRHSRSSSSSSSSSVLSAIRGRLARKDSGVAFDDGSDKNKKQQNGPKKEERPRRPIVQPETNFVLRDKICEKMEVVINTNRADVSAVHRLREMSPHKKSKSVSFKGEINVTLCHNVNPVEGLPDTPLLSPGAVKLTALTKIKSVLHLPIEDPVEKPIKYKDELNEEPKLKIRHSCPSIRQKLALNGDDILRSSPIDIPGVAEKVAKDKAKREMEEDFMANFNERYACCRGGYGLLDPRKFELGQYTVRDLRKIARYVNQVDETHEVLHSRPNYDLSPIGITTAGEFW